MILTLAFRNLFHDRVRLIVTLVGILFSIVLVAVQLGLYLGSSKMILGMINHSNAQLWIAPYGTNSFEENSLMDGRENHTALSVPGVTRVVPVIAAFVRWRKPGGGNTLASLIGTDPEDGGLAPWNIVEGSIKDLALPDAVAVDRTYLKELGISGIGARAQVLDQRVKVTALTNAIRSFTRSPYIFTTLSRARSILGASRDQASFYLVSVDPKADIDEVRKTLQARLPNVDVIETNVFADRALTHWLLKTGAGIALIGGAVLGLIVGTVIVAQTLYSSTKDHLNEFATLRALGSKKGYIYRVILAQAGLSGLVGYILGMSIALFVVFMSQGSALPVVMTPNLAIGLLALTLFMCAVSAIAAISKVTRLDPAMVFSR